MRLRSECWLAASLLAAPVTVAQLNLPGGYLNFNTSTFSVALVKDSQTLYSLKPASSSFDFIPADKMSQRAANGQHHLGDITFRARKVGSTAWVSADSATTRRAVTALSSGGTTLAAANLAPTLPSGSLLNVTRRWVVQNSVLQLLFDVSNSQTSAVEIGSLGIPLEFNSVRHVKGVLSSSNPMLNQRRFSPTAQQRRPTSNVVCLILTLDKMLDMFKSPPSWVLFALSSWHLSASPR
jgi:hypothetical protein